MAGPADSLEQTRLGWFAPIKIQSFLRFIAQLHQFRGSCLETKRHFIGSNSRADFGIANRAQSLSIQAFNRCDRIALQVRRDASRVVDIQDRSLPLRKRVPA